MSRALELAKKTGLISLGRISTQFVSFLLLPLYTALLSTEQYGVVDLVMTLVQLLVPVTSMMLDQGAFRFLLNCETDDEKSAAITSAATILLISCAVSLVVGLVVVVAFRVPYCLHLVIILVTTSVLNLLLQVARGLKRTGEYSLGSFACSALTIVFNVLFIAGLGMGAEGMLTASIIGNFSACLLLAIRVRLFEYFKPRSFDRETALAEIRYSLPLAPNQLSLWIINSSDRLIVTFVLGAAANGVLAISHKFPAIFMAFFNMFLLAWHEVGAVHYFDEDRDEFFSKMVNDTISLFSTLCIAALVALPLFFDLLIDSSFAEAYYTIPLYMVASLFNIVVGLLGVVYVATKRTGEIAKTTLLAAVVNIVVNVALINFIGLYAAAVAALAGYFATFVYRVIDARNYLRITYDKKRLAVVAASVLISCAAFYLRNSIVSVALCAICVMVGYMLNKGVVLSTIAIMRRKVTK